MMIYENNISSIHSDFEQIKKRDTKGSEHWTSPHFVIVSPNNKCYKDTKYFLSISYSTYLLNNEVGRYEYTAKLHPSECSFTVSYIFFSILSMLSSLRSRRC